MSTETTAQNACTANGILWNTGADTDQPGLFRFNLPAIGGTITAATLDLYASAVYLTPALIAHCHKSAINWGEASTKATMETVRTELAGKSATSTTEVGTGAGWKSFDILGTSGSSGTGILRAYELAESDVTIVLRYGTSSSFGYWGAGGSSFTIGFDAKNTGDDNINVYSRTNATYYPRLTITYTEASGSSATRSVLLSPILNSSIVRW